MHLLPREEMIRQVNSPATKDFVDADARFDGDAICSTEGFVGNCIFLQVGDGCKETTCLVKVRDIAYVESAEGFRYMSHLKGDVVWGEVPWKRINIDRRDYYREREWRERDDFRRYMFGFPNSQYQVLVREAEYTVLRTNGYNLVAQTRMDALDLVTESEIDWTVNTTTNPTCERIVQNKCTSFICLSNCEVIEEEDDTLGDCNCPDSFPDNPLGSCLWMEWSRCEPINCRWPAGCRRGFMSCTCS